MGKKNEQAKKQKATHTRACAAHNADGLLRQDREGQVPEHMGQVVTVAHLYVVEGDLPLLGPRDGRSGRCRTLSRRFTLQRLR